MSSAETEEAFWARVHCATCGEKPVVPPALHCAPCLARFQAALSKAIADDLAREAA